jgi:hypothetical protein
MTLKAPSELAFDSRVEEELILRDGVRAQGTFSPELCLDAGEMYRSIATQIKSWERLTELYGDQPIAQRRFAQRVAVKIEIDARGVLDVLRQGLRDRVVQIDLAYFRPGHTLADDSLAECHANVLTFARQLHYSVREPHRSVDIDAAVDSIDRQLDFLAERRQTLIAAAVTGTIDVTTARGLDILPCPIASRQQQRSHAAAISARGLSTCWFGCARVPVVTMPGPVRAGKRAPAGRRQQRCPGVVVKSCFSGATSSLRCCYSDKSGTTLLPKTGLNNNAGTTLLSRPVGADHSMGTQIENLCVGATRALPTTAIPRCPCLPPANDSKAPTLSSVPRRRTKQSGIAL